MSRDAINLNMERESVSMDDISARKYVTLLLSVTRIPYKKGWRLLRSWLVVVGSMRRESMRLSVLQRD